MLGVRPDGSLGPSPSGGEVFLLAHTFGGQEDRLGVVRIEFQRPVRFLARLLPSFGTFILRQCPRLLLQVSPAQDVGATSARVHRDHLEHPRVGLGEVLEAISQQTGQLLVRVELLRRKSDDLPQRLAGAIVLP